MKPLFRNHLRRLAASGLCLFVAACSAGQPTATAVSEAETAAASLATVVASTSTAIDELLAIQCPWGDGECTWPDGTASAPASFAPEWLPVASTPTRRDVLASSFVMQGSGFAGAVQLRLRTSGVVRGRLNVELRAADARLSTPLAGRLLQRGRLSLRDVVPDGNVQLERDVRVTLDTVAPVTRLVDLRTYWLVLSITPDDAKTGAALEVAAISTVGLDQLARNNGARLCHKDETSPGGMIDCDGRSFTKMADGRVLGFLPSFERSAHASCFDRRRNGREAGLDCGAVCGKPCGQRALCTVDGDCDPRNVMPERQTSCRKRNDGTDDACLDGGCVCRLKLTLGAVCSEDGDCATGLCMSSTAPGAVATPPRCSPTTCSDTKKSFDETDVNCGGSCALRCGEGRACRISKDCAGGFICGGGKCIRPLADGATCTNPWQCLNGRCSGKRGAMTCSSRSTPGGTCGLRSDCTSGVCIGGRCKAPGVDRVRNGAESDVDCGGDAPKRCAVGRRCAAPTDCADGLSCGSGGRCGRPDGGVCKKAAECVSELCFVSRNPEVPSKCVTRVDDAAEEHCRDLVKDNDETDVDCGGSCGPCVSGKSCSLPEDCASKVCSGAGKCSTATCSDGVLNNPLDRTTKAPLTEVGIDCGGPCAKCAAGAIVLSSTLQQTVAFADLPARLDQVRTACTSGMVSDRLCADETCVAYDVVCLDPTCWDKVKNGDESDIDCGGKTCGRCRVTCSADTDCATGGCVGGYCATAPVCAAGAECETGVCRSKVCARASVSDAVRNGKETGIDCGGPGAPRCAFKKPCAVDGDCASTSQQPLLCALGVCVAPSCRDGEPSTSRAAKETSTDCGGICGRCPVVDGDAAAQAECGGNADCASGLCVTAGDKKRCALPSTADAFKNGTESDKNCGGGSDKRCGYGNVCTADTDCGNQYVCLAGRCGFGVCGNSTKAFTAAKSATPPSTSTDLCGRACSTLCAEKNYCWGDFDCGTGRDCLGHACELPVCSILQTDGTTLVVTRGTTMPGNGCLVCDPLRSQTGWSLLRENDPCSDGDAGTTADSCKDPDGAGDAIVQCSGDPITCAAIDAKMTPCLAPWTPIPDTEFGSCTVNDDGTDSCEEGKACRFGRCEGVACRKVRKSFGTACGTLSGGDCGGGRCTGVDDTCPGEGTVMAKGTLCRTGRNDCYPDAYCPGDGDTTCHETVARSDGEACQVKDAATGDVIGDGYCTQLNGETLLSCVTNVCGDGKLQFRYEQCDAGAANGQEGSGCSATCTTVGSVCDAGTNGGCWSSPDGAKKAKCSVADGGGVACACPEGYEDLGGFGASGCRLFDPCATCDATATCDSRSTTPECACAKGLVHASADASSKCVDVDECATTDTKLKLDCGAATCTNTVGGAYCACPEGQLYSSKKCIVKGSATDPCSKLVCKSGICVVDPSTQPLKATCAEDLVGQPELLTPVDEPAAGTGTSVRFNNIVNIAPVGDGHFQILDRTQTATEDSVALRVLQTSLGAVSQNLAVLERNEIWDGQLASGNVLSIVISDRGQYQSHIVRGYVPASGDEPPGLIFAPPGRTSGEAGFKALPDSAGCSLRALSGTTGSYHLPASGVLSCASGALYVIANDVRKESFFQCPDAGGVAYVGDSRPILPGDQGGCRVCVPNADGNGAQWEQVDSTTTCEKLSFESFIKLKRRSETPGRLVATSGVDADADSLASRYEEGEVTVTPNPDTNGFTKTTKGKLALFARSSTGSLLRFEGDYKSFWVNYSRGDNIPDSREVMETPVSFTKSELSKTDAWKAFGVSPDGWVYGVGKAARTDGACVSGSGAACKKDKDYSLPDGYKVQDGDWVRFSGTTMAVAPAPRDGAGKVLAGVPRTYLRLYSCVGGTCCSLGTKADDMGACGAPMDECTAAPFACIGPPTMNCDDVAGCFPVEAPGISCDKVDENGRVKCELPAGPYKCVDTAHGFSCEESGGVADTTNPATDPPVEGVFRNIVSFTAMPGGSTSTTTASGSFVTDTATRNAAFPFASFIVLDAASVGPSASAGPSVNVAPAAAADGTTPAVWERLIVGYDPVNGVPATKTDTAIGPRRGVPAEMISRGWLPTGWVGQPGEPAAMMSSLSPTTVRTRTAWTSWAGTTVKTPKTVNGKPASVFTQAGTITPTPLGKTAVTPVTVVLTNSVPFAWDDPTKPVDGDAPNLWHFPSPWPYASEGVPAPSRPDGVGLREAGRRSLTLSTGVTDLYLAVAGFNANTLTFDKPFTIVSSADAMHAGQWGSGGVVRSTGQMTIDGKSVTAYVLSSIDTAGEFHGVLRFHADKAFKALTWDSGAEPAADAANLITVGIGLDVFQAAGVPTAGLPVDALATTAWLPVGASYQQTATSLDRSTDSLDSTRPVAATATALPDQLFLYGDARLPLSCLVPKGVAGPFLGCGEAIYDLRDQSVRNLPLELPVAVDASPDAFERVGTGDTSFLIVAAKDGTLGKVTPGKPAAFPATMVPAKWELLDKSSTRSWGAFGVQDIGADPWVYGIGLALRVRDGKLVKYGLPDGYVVSEGDWVRFAGETMAVARFPGVDAAGAALPRNRVRFYRCREGSCWPLTDKAQYLPANAACIGDFQCQSGACGFSASRSVGTCASVPRCVAGEGTLGTSCFLDSQCQSCACKDTGSGSQCVQPCGEDSKFAFNGEYCPDGLSCSTNAVCVASPTSCSSDSCAASNTHCASSKCVCNEGFRLDDSGNCIASVTSIDAGAACIQSASCGANATCGELNRCRCNTGYYSLHSDGTACISPVPDQPAAVVVRATALSLFSDTQTGATAHTVSSWTADDETSTVKDVFNPWRNADGVKQVSLSNAATMDFSAAPVDGLGLAYLHLDVWTGEYLKLKVGLLDRTNDTNTQFKTAPMQSVGPGQWVALDLPLAAFGFDPVPRKLSKLKLSLDGTGSATLYVDNVYFYSAPSGSTGTCRTGTACIPWTCVAGYCLTPSDASAIANANLQLHLDDIAKALYAFKDSKLVDDVLDDGGSTTAEQLDLRDEFADLRKWLVERVFDVGSIDPDSPEADATHVVFKMRPQKVCPTTTTEDVDVVDEDCKRALDTEPIRLVASSPSVRDLDLRIFVGTRHPMVLALHDEAVWAKVDLDVATEALKALATAADDETADVPKLSGTVQVQVSRESKERYRVEVSAPTDLRLAHGDVSTNDLVDIRVSAGDNLLRLVLDGPFKTLSGTVDAGRVDVMAALNLLFERPPTTTCTPDATAGKPPTCVDSPAAPRMGALGLHLAGVKAGLKFDANADVASLAGLGLGDATSTVTFGADTLLKLEINPDDGRHFNATFQATDAGTTGALSPKLDVRVDYNFAPLADQFREELAVDSWRRDGFFKLLFNGTSPKVLFPTEVSCDSGTCATATKVPHAQVLSGSLSLTSAIAGVVADSPLCIADKEPAPSTVNHPLDTLASGTCSQATCSVGTNCTTFLGEPGIRDASCRCSELQAGGCSFSSQCSAGQLCYGGKCVTAAGGASCLSAEDCASGSYCDAGDCKTAP